MDCNPDQVTIPTNSTPVPCDAVYTSTDCIVTPSAISFLTINEGDSQTQVNTALVLALMYKQQQIEELAARIEALENP